MANASLHPQLFSFTLFLCCCLFSSFLSSFSVSFLSAIDLSYHFLFSCNTAKTTLNISCYGFLLNVRVTWRQKSYEKWQILLVNVEEFFRRVIHSTSGLCNELVKLMSGEATRPNNALESRFFLPVGLQSHWVLYRVDTIGFGASLAVPLYGKKDPQIRQ